MATVSISVVEQLTHHRRSSARRCAIERSIGAKRQASEGRGTLAS